MTTEELKKYKNKIVYAVVNSKYNTKSLKKYKITKNGNFSLVNIVMPGINSAAHMNFIQKYYPLYINGKPSPDKISDIELKIIVKDENKNRCFYKKSLTFES